MSWTVVAIAMSCQKMRQRVFPTSCPGNKCGEAYLAALINECKLDSIIGVLREGSDFRGYPTELLVRKPYPRAFAVNVFGHDPGKDGRTGLEEFHGSGSRLLYLRLCVPIWQARSRFVTGHARHQWSPT